MTDTYLRLPRKAWQGISVVSSFPVIIFLAAVLVSYDIGGSLYIIAWRTGVFLAFFTLIPGLAFIYFYLQGYITDIEARNKEEREPVFLIALLSAFLGIVAMHQLGIAAPMLDLSLLQTVLLMLVYAINKSWKISIHMTSWGACLTAVWFVYGNIALILLPLVLPVALSRFALDCHTRNQVIAGFVVGVVMAALVFLR